jgi:hypothetical protein
MKTRLFMKRNLIVLMLLVISINSSILMAKEKLAVFYPSDVTPKQRESLFKKDKAFNQFEVVVFGKYKEFEKYIKKFKVKFILTHSAFEEFSKKFKPFLQFTLNEKKTFKYVIVGPKNKKKLKSIGMVDVIGRKKSKKYIKKIVKNKKIKKIKRVGHKNDLMTLLLIDSVDGILVSSDDVEKIKKSSPMKIEIKGESRTVKYPSFYTSSKAVKSSIKLNAITIDAIKKLGFHGVSVIEKK